MPIKPTDELCRVDQTSRVKVKRIDPAIRHSQKASRKGPWVLRVATRAAWRRPTVFTTIASHSDCPCGGRLYFGEYSVKVETPRLHLVIHSSWPMEPRDSALLD
jgi:hypothetical protein